MYNCRRIFNIFSALSCDWTDHGFDSYSMLEKFFTPQNHKRWSDRNRLCKVLAKDYIQDRPVGSAEGVRETRDTRARRQKAVGLYESVVTVMIWSSLAGIRPEYLPPS